MYRKATTDQVAKEYKINYFILDIVGMYTNLKHFITRKLETNKRI